MTERIRFLDVVLIIAVFIVSIAIWEAVIRVFDISPIVVPAPSAVWNALVDGLSENVTSQGGFYWNTFYTAAEALIGFVIGSVAGLVLAIVLSQWRIMERVFMPYIVAFQLVPKIALAPLFVIWFGFGMTSKVVLVITITFFPVLVGALAGFRNVETNRLRLMRSLRASEWQIFRMVRFPGALPYIFAGLETAIVFSLIAAVVGEFIGAQEGLGVLLINYQSVLNIAGVFAIFIVLAFVGIVFYLGLVAVRRKVLFWAPDQLAGPRL